MTADEMKLIDSLLISAFWFLHFLHKLYFILIAAKGIYCVSCEILTSSVLKNGFATLMFL